MFQAFNPEHIEFTKYLFFTGKGGVGKTSSACATAVSLADKGKRVLLISTDPASNLQDVFKTDLNNTGISIDGLPQLVVVNLDPILAAAEYRESVIGPYKGLLPDAVITNMEEQLSGSCTVEIAAFNEFSKFITDVKIQNDYDFVIFDTAPTGHTLRLLQLPSAWSNFISENTHGASCLGQLSGLESQKEVYKKAVETLADGKLTTLVLVSRPEIATLLEAERASNELLQIGIKNQIMILNGILNEYDDAVSESFYKKQQAALSNLPDGLKAITTYSVPLRGYNVLGLNNLRALFTYDSYSFSPDQIDDHAFKNLNDIVEHIINTHKKVIFTMGKGGVGKTTIAAAIAMGLSDKGQKVHLTTTDPAAHLKNVVAESANIKLSHIDEQVELAKYREEVLTTARAQMAEEDLAYIEEDLNSPCTQEIAVFRAFAEIVDNAEHEIVIIDTAPTGHTLLLLESTQSYNQEIERSKGAIPASARKLLPRLHNADETEVIIVTLPEATPVYEARRLEDDLKRAGISTKWWIINSSLYQSKSSNHLLSVKASNEVEWINKVAQHTNGDFALIAWHHEEIKGDGLRKLFA